MSISKIKHAAKSLKNFQGIRFEECLDDGEAAEQLNKWLLEVSWEVANKVGGIYTVIRSKVPVTKKEYGNNYICLGPYNDSFVKTEVEIGESKLDVIRDTVNEMKRLGIHVVTGNWLIEGFPQVVLFDIGSAIHRLDDWKGDFFRHARIGIPYHDREANDALVFGFCVFWFIGIFIDQVKRRQKCYVIAHFHEWLTGVGLIMTRLCGYDCALIFTTHATLLGRYLCAGSTDFYNNLPLFDLDKEAGNRRIYHRYCIERAAASCTHVFTTVSKITGIESEYLLKKKPDVLTPNGLNVQKFAALHEFQNLHAQNKEKLHAFVRGHFYGHYDFDLDKTLYIFTAGRYEFTNKGADMFIESLARLNHMLKSSGSDVTVVAFLIFPTATNNFNVESLRGQSIAKMFRDTVSNIQSDIGKRLYEISLKGHLPTPAEILLSSDLIELKKCIYGSQRSTLPPICTHNVCDDIHDPILNALRRCELFNARSDRVKVIFHPEFLRSTSPLLPLDYDEFVRGCHLGVFPSYYEPWGYTPAECTVLGVPNISTNLSGFGCFMEEHVHEAHTYGIYIVDRRYKSGDESCQQLAQYMFDFSLLTRRQRIILRNRTERLSELLDWNVLGIYYYRARQIALTRIHPEFEEEIIKLANETSSNPSTPVISRSSTPAPHEHDDEGTDDEDESHPPPPSQISSQKVSPKQPSSIDQAFEPSFARPASATHLPLDKQFRAAAVAAANAAATDEPTFTDALDDEIRQITIGKDNQSKLTSTSQTIKHDDKVDFSLDDLGDLDDSHDSQEQVPYEDNKTSISTKHDFTIPDVLQQTTITGNTTSGESTSGAENILSSSNLKDQPNTKSTEKEQS
ncbi:unnamed protein product [Rotaria sordida]|uniref:Glycogen [starch] synthase n=1 Tax=Rotaria sordida TaxID=392033 RepID=A0A814AV53_9BILA|nr:unnamed protein product [Rotaria sordida]CAF0978302.1 unnamed protein product [Rotaria sordida]CAF3573243.1 unnamed protein product [Rotaria sordida]